MELKQEKKPENIIIEEFKALINNLIPTNLKQVEWICDEIERLTHEHPELKENSRSGLKCPSPREEIIHHILAEAERAHQKW